MKQSISSIFVIITLLFSMTEISKVALMGYTLFTDGEKAALFCTCMGCSHDTDSEKESCSTDMSDDSSHSEKSEPMHCNMTSTASGESVCGCEKDSSGEMHILFNTLDKTALLAEFQYKSREFNRTSFRQNRVEDPVSVQRDIFHPPRS